MGLFGILVTVALVGVAGLGGTAAYLYATDYAMEADVKATDCKGPATDDLLNVVAIKTRTFGIDHAVKGIPDQQCNLLQAGDHVVYHVRTKHTTIYRDGEVCYDSDTGPGIGCLARSSPGFLG